MILLKKYSFPWNEPKIFSPKYFFMASGKDPSQSITSDHTAGKAILENLFEYGAGEYLELDPRGVAGAFCTCWKQEGSRASAAGADGRGSWMCSWMGDAVPRIVCQDEGERRRGFPQCSQGVRTSKPASRRA